MPTANSDAGIGPVPVFVQDIACSMMANGHGLRISNVIAHEVEVSGLVCSLEYRTRKSSESSIHSGQNACGRIFGLQDGTGFVECYEWADDVIENEGMSWAPNLSLGDVVIVTAVAAQSAFGKTILRVVNVVKICDVLQEVHWISRALFLRRQVYTPFDALPVSHHDGISNKQTCSTWCKVQGDLIYAFDVSDLKLALRKSDILLGQNDISLLLDDWHTRGYVFTYGGLIYKVSSNSAAYLQLLKDIVDAVKAAPDFVDYRFLCSNLEQRGYKLSPTLLQMELRNLSKIHKGRIISDPSGVYFKHV